MANVCYVIHSNMYKLTLILATNYSSFIWIELSIEEREAMTNGFPPQTLDNWCTLTKE